MTLHGRLEDESVHAGDSFEGSEPKQDAESSHANMRMELNEERVPKGRASNGVSKFDVDEGDSSLVEAGDWCGTSFQNK